MDGGRFHIIGIGSIIPDMGSRHRHDLTAIRWISQDFLVTGHRGIEYQFTRGLKGAMDPTTEKHPVAEHQKTIADHWSLR